MIITLLTTNTVVAESIADAYHGRKLERFFIKSHTVADVNAPPCIGLEGFPEVFCTIPSLQSLSFSDQHLYEIPDGLSQLTRLSQLIIR